MTNFASCTQLDAALRRCSERPLELQPAIDAAEAFLLTVFLRRYVTYCARQGKYAAMNGAARLFVEVSGRAMNVLVISAAILGAAGVLLSSPAAQGETAIVRPPLAVATSFEATMMRVVPYPDDRYALPAVEPYSCYRFRRCSVYDLYYFADRPNWLTRLAPEAPAESVELPPSTQYQWFFVPVTPEQNILPKYRTASQVRDEYRSVGRPLDEPD